MLLTTALANMSGYQLENIKVDKEYRLIIASIEGMRVSYRSWNRQRTFS